MQSIRVLAQRLGSCLEVLNAADTGLDDQIEILNEALPKFTAIRVLMLNPREHGLHFVHHLWQAETLTGFSYCSQLRELYMCSNYALTDAVSAFVHSIHTFFYVYLQSLQLLVERLSHTLQILDVSRHMNLMLTGEHMSRVTASSLALIGKLTKLEKLNVGGQPVDKPMIDAIASGCTLLKVCIVWKTVGMSPHTHRNCTYSARNSTTTVSSHSLNIVVHSSD